MEGMQPGETLIKDSGMFPVAWNKSTFSTVNGKLILTNQRLVFAAGRFQNPIEGLRGAHKERVELSLGDITSVDKGMMATVKVTAGQEYTFKGMRNAKQWVDLITKAVRDAQTTPAHTPPQPTYQPPQPTPTPPPQPAPQPTPAAQRGQFCTECGTPTDTNDKFCGNCGKKL